MGRVRDAGNKSYGAVRIGSHGDLLDGETITIGDPLNGGKVFEWDDDAAVTDGNILVDIGANAEAAIDNLKAAINAQLGALVVAYDDPVEVETLRIEGANPGNLGNLAFETDMAHASNIIAASGDDTLSGGSNDANRARASLEYTVTALDVAAENVMIPTPFEAPVLGAVHVRDGDGVTQYISDEITVAGTRVQIAKAGATNLAEGDKVYVEVFSAD
jgi:hypothetical protein